MLNADNIGTDHLSPILQFRVHCSARVGGVVNVFTRGSFAQFAQVTKILPIECPSQDTLIVCEGAAISPKEANTFYALSPVQEAELRLVPRWCSNLLRSPGHLWAVCGEVVAIGTFGALICPSCGYVLFRETKIDPC